jgi:hypothetical protein
MMIGSQERGLWYKNSYCEHESPQRREDPLSRIPIEDPLCILTLGDAPVASWVCQLFDKVHGLPQTAQAALRSAPVDGVAYPEARRNVSRALLEEHKGFPRRDLVG